MGFDIGIDKVVEEGAKLLGKFIEDKDQRSKIAHELATMGSRHGHAEALAQMEVNEKEAGHSSIFVAGWRPFVGWTCGLAMFNNYIVIPYFPSVPQSDLTTMLPILGGMLGFGYMRMKEKQGGVARTHLGE